MKSPFLIRSKATKRWLLTSLAALTGVLITGCAQVGVQEQRLVSKPNMTFTDYAVFNAPPRLFQQSEPGASDTGGAASAGCSSCR